ncbi:FecR family protein [Caulobacter sp. KR2-114]|uniref:FecR family protein n=1 Tax=Caulobacter sp. KR2-114 TaxID=3400912 RepID=UPI003C09F27B
MAARQTASEVEAEAVGFALRLEQDGRTPALEAELQAWLAGDSRRAGALLQAEAALALMAAAPVQAASPARQAGRVNRRLVAAAAGVATAGGALGLWSLSRGQGRRYDTDIGEIRRVPLADGSTVAINTQSAVTVSLDEGLRHVRLRRGEAWFQVAKDSARPFVVEAGAVRVRAVGTAFSVRELPDRVEVLVTEGVVEAWRQGDAAARLQIAAGRMAVVGDQGPVLVRANDPTVVDRTLAWRDGKIDLAGETLGEAAAEFNRYNTRKVIVDDPALARAPLYGVFRADDPEGFAQAVAQSLGARVSLQGQITISADHQPTA